MFYHEKDGAFLIRGIFRSVRAAERWDNAARTYASLAYRKRGGSIFTASGEKVCAEDGSITYIPAGCSFFRDSPAEELIVLHLHPLGTTDDRLRVIGGMDTLLPLFETMADEWENKTVGYENRCTANLYAVFSHIEKSKQFTHPKLQLIRDGVTLMEKRCQDASFSVTDAAAVCHISDVYFRKIYREIYGTTPVHALLVMRLERAKTYLQSGRHTVSETSYLSGFSDMKYFSSAFRNYFGITPSDFAAMR